MTSQGLTGDSTVFITGGMDQLGNWDPGKVKMIYRGDHTWVREIVISKPVTIEYKYTLGSWDREGTNANGETFPNFEAKISRDTIIKDKVPNWISKKPRDTGSTITGTLRIHRGMKGRGIRDRDIIVWLPPDYENAKSKPYPVVYMQDGQNIFDAATSAYGAEWRIDETADSLIKMGKIPPVIVVGIYNTSDRNDEYIPGKKGTAYMDFMVKRLKPFIDSAYRTMPDAKHTIVGGASAGGTISFMLVWEYPDVFSKAICMSSAFKTTSIDCVTPVKKYSGKKKPVFFYIDIGGVGLESELLPGNDEMISVLKEKGYREGIDFVYFRDPSAKHFETDWAKRFPAAIMLCLPGE
jgi:enterochelin esterase-like enzyme